jgi:predicted restriction endonuclease
MSKKIEEILEVLDDVRNRYRYDKTTPTRDLRRQADLKVAERRRIDPTTVSNKYRRGLKPLVYNTNSFDAFVDSWLRNNSSELRDILLQHCLNSQDQEMVRRFFSSVQALPTLTPVAVDLDEPSQPAYVRQETYRILRDTRCAREVKAAYSYSCQLCGKSLTLFDGSLYAESHHVKPLGRPHNEPDIRSNIMCVCPNCHALLDYGSVKLDPELLPEVRVEFVHYHNTQIFGKIRWSS